MERRPATSRFLLRSYLDIRILSFHTILFPSCPKSASKNLSVLLLATLLPSFPCLDSMKESAEQHSLSNSRLRTGSSRCIASSLQANHHSAPMGYT